MASASPPSTVLRSRWSRLGAALAFMAVASLTGMVELSPAISLFSTRAADEGPASSVSPAAVLPEGDRVATATQAGSSQPTGANADVGGAGGNSGGGSAERLSSEAVVPRQAASRLPPQPATEAPRAQPKQTKTKVEPPKQVRPANLLQQERQQRQSAAVGKLRTGKQTWSLSCKPYPGKRVILVQANSQYLEMFRNWLYHAARFLDAQTDQLVIAAESQGSVPVMKSLSGLFGVSWDVQVLPTCGTSCENSNEVSTYGQGVWSKVVTHRPLQILRLLDQGCSVLYVDIDTVWTKPLFSEFHAIGQHDIYIASDNDNPRNRHLCTCLMYYQPTAQNRQLMDRWAKSLTGEKSNQYPFNRVLTSMERQLDFHVLSLEKFPPGKLLFLHNRSAVVLHANFVSGAGGKVSLLKNLGYWNPSGTAIASEPSAQAAP